MKRRYSLKPECYSNPSPNFCPEKGIIGKMTNVKKENRSIVKH
jgi:hypothetical protein